MTSVQDVLRRTKTITFDCYGTLIDWSAGLSRSFSEIFGPAVAGHEREWFEAYVRIEAEIESGPYRSYREVLAAVSVRLARRFKLPLLPGRERELAEMLPSWAPFRDTNEALARLKRRFRLGVLSNIDRDLFAGTTRQLGTSFDFVLTAEDVRSYKPAHAHFRQFLDAHGGVATALHVAQSLYHDGAPASDLGLAFVWINRYNEPSHTNVRPVAEFPDLRSFADTACCDSIIDGRPGLKDL